MLAVCGWNLHVMPPPKSAQLLRWDGKKAAGADPHRAVLCCATCAVRAGVWSFLPLGKDFGSPAGAYSLLCLLYVSGSKITTQVMATFESKHSYSQ